MDPALTDLQIIHTVGSLRNSAGGPSRTVTALCTELGRLDLQIDLFSQDSPAADPNDHLVMPLADQVRTTLVNGNRWPEFGRHHAPTFGAALRDRWPVAPTSAVAR